MADCYFVHWTLASYPSDTLQTSVDSVEALMKKHNEVESTSTAHDERARALSEQANRLIQAGHYDNTRYTCMLY